MKGRTYLLIAGFSRRMNQTFKLFIPEIITQLIYEFYQQDFHLSAHKNSTIVICNGKAIAFGNNETCSLAPYTGRYIDIDRPHLVSLNNIRFGETLEGFSYFITQEGHIYKTSIETNGYPKHILEKELKGKKATWLTTQPVPIDTQSHYLAIKTEKNHLLIFKHSHSLNYYTKILYIDLHEMSEKPIIALGGEGVFIAEEKRIYSIPYKDMGPGITKQSSNLIDNDCMIRQLHLSKSYLLPEEIFKTVSDEKIVSMLTGMNNFKLNYQNHILIGTTKRLVCFKEYSENDIREKQSATPVDIHFSNHNEFIVKMCKGMFHYLLLSNKGNVYGFGANHYGQITDKNEKIQEKLFTPMLVDLKQRFDLDEDESFLDMSAGQTHTILLTKKSNKILVYGANSYGQIHSMDKYTDMVANVMTTWENMVNSTHCIDQSLELSDIKQESDDNNLYIVLQNEPVNTSNKTKNGVICFYIFCILLLFSAVGSGLGALVSQYKSIPSHVGQIQLDQMTAVQRSTLFGLVPGLVFGIIISLCFILYKKINAPDESKMASVVQMEQHQASNTQLHA